MSSIKAFTLSDRKKARKLGEIWEEEVFERKAGIECPCGEEFYRVTKTLVIFEEGHCRNEFGKKLLLKCFSCGLFQEI